MPKRLTVFSFAIVSFSIVLIARLFYWQIIRGQDLAAEARSQQKNGYSVRASRGNILASDGTWLTATVESFLVYAMLPEITHNKTEIAESLAKLFVGDTDKEVLYEETARLKSLLSKNDVKWVPLRRKVDRETRDAIDALNYSGIGFETHETRIYPEASSAAHLLGFVGKNKNDDDIGYFGLEGFYDVSLTGKEGFISRVADAVGIPILTGESREVSAITGASLLTHVDKGIQLTLDTKLLEGIETYGATAGVAVVMDPTTGAILGMSAYPSFDPASYSDFEYSFFTNPVVSQSFEPGSVFKVLVMAAGLDAGVVKPDTICDICSGPLSVSGYQIGTWNDQYYPNSTMSEVIIHSDNVGMTYVGKKLGADKLHDYLTAFGIGQKTEIDLQGEAAPKLRTKGSWSEVDLATATFGQGVAVTPIQLSRAVGAIANGGVIKTPQVVDKLVGEGWEEDLKTSSGKRVISERAAYEITEMMVEAAKNGEAKWTHLRGYKVAGKTGTAQIPIAGHYDAEKTIASFVGFAPYDDPKFLMLVTLREPKTSQWASETAAPLWYTIAKDLFLFLGIQPES